MELMTNRRNARFRKEIDSMNESIYEAINNGVYRSGFASSQDKYEEAVKTLFNRLDELESYLENRSFLIAECLTEADIRLIPTLLRFDLVYYLLLFAFLSLYRLDCCVFRSVIQSLVLHLHIWLIYILKHSIGKRHARDGLSSFSGRRLSARRAFSVKNSESLAF